MYIGTWCYLSAHHELCRSCVDRLDYRLKPKLDDAPFPQGLVPTPDRDVQHADALAIGFFINNLIMVLSTHVQTEPILLNLLELLPVGLNVLQERNNAIMQKTRFNSSRHKELFDHTCLSPIRARFAPSPTGYLHLGSLRTALFNCLAARASKKGAFILRIEDTDQKRVVHDAEERLIDDLKWAGLKWDEGPDCGGPYGPYKQSLRLDIYKTHVQKLLDDGHAYRCFCSAEQLQSQKQELLDAGKSTEYPGTCRAVDAAESDMRASRGDAHVVRFKGDAFGILDFVDAVYGHFRKKVAEEDFVLMKSDGFPTYHFANVVDDHLMKITHVIRGEEWLISTPKHLALYQAFGWDPPTFAHLGLLINPDGTKLSKRNFSTDLATYRKEGLYYPMSLLNWLANLGSSFEPDTLSHPVSVEDLAQTLSFKFTRGGIKLNFEKIDHFQVKYLDALLGESRPATLRQVEKDRIIHRYITEPAFQEFEQLARGDPKKLEQLPEFWRENLTLISATSDLGHNAQKHLFDIMTTHRGGFLPYESLIQQHPYLVFQVPERLYLHSLASYKPDERVIEALDKALKRSSLWMNRVLKRSSPRMIHEEYEDHDKHPAMEAIWTYLKGQAVNKVAVHKTLRFIAAGSHDVVSLGSSRMFTLLGRHEWQHRLQTVKTLLGRGVDGSDKKEEEGGQLE
ncbi:hypothetical protein E4U55_002558 [Claviceps digitariae]|nr:hypothetical protein E4U55_002558 [Claviceps digitariae]